MRIVTLLNHWHAAPMRWVIFTIYIMLAANSPGAPKVFRDTFDGKLAHGWVWRRERPEAWRIGQKGLEIRVEPGNMWGPQNDARNILIRSVPNPVTERVSISMTLSNRPTEQYEQVDLVWYYDDSNMVKIGQEMVDGKLSIVMGREQNDRTRTIAIIPIEAYALELRLTATNQTVRGAFRSLDSKNWQEAGFCDLPIRGEPRAAIQCYQGPAKTEHWARITDFRIETE